MTEETTGGEAVKFQSSDVQNIFNISRETVRQWSMKFSDFLSPSALQGSGDDEEKKGKWRFFTLADMQVFALVSELSGKMTLDEIHASLANGSRGHVPAGIQGGISPYEARVQLARSIDRIDHLQNENEELKGEVMKLNAELAALKSTDQNYIGRIETLSREIGKLEALLEIERDKNKKPSDT